MNTTLSELTLSLLYLQVVDLVRWVEIYKHRMLEILIENYYRESLN
jgi:hypothetical protein